jgi:predicted MPP superfamily phosphohydrolase
MNRFVTVVALVVCALVFACSGVAADELPGNQSRRIVALGDIHGDVEQLRAALVMAQLVDNSTGKWIGGPTDKLVQVGDMLDRGPHDKQVLDEVMRLQKEAAAAGSGFVVLLGNHEIMNLRGQVHYVHPEAFEAYGGKAAHQRAMAADGEYGAWLRTLPVVHIDMDTVFVHAGLLPEYARRGVDALNAGAAQELAAADENKALRSGAADDILGVNGPVWTRRIVHRAQQGDCQLVAEAVKALGVERMVVGHTPQSAGTLGDFCDTRLVVVDVGMSKWMYGNLAMLELTLPATEGAEVELREILPHTALEPEQPAAEEVADTIDAELQRDPVRLQEIFDTVRQAASWATGASAAKEEDAEKKAEGEL